jgi:nitric oxide dioxygenase
MLSRATLDIVQSTAPVLASQGQAITTLFYRKLFDHHPELMHVFNMANQAQGKQARALAESVFMVATHIEKLHELGPMVKHIAHKHASLGVAPEQYPIVGKHLLAAIRDHLGLAADDPVLGAWAEAYGQLADIFIDTEATLYRENADKAGGWRGWRPFVIDSGETVAAGIRSIRLRPEDGGPIAGFLPGQYVGVKLRPAGSEYDEIRQYSLADAPGKATYRIMVKAESTPPAPAGKVSNHLHDMVPGARVWLQPPTGAFTIERSARPLTLIAGGVGITPLLSMLLHRIETADDVSDLTFVHCCRDRAHHILGDALRALSAQHGFRYYVSYEAENGGDHRGYLDRAVLSQWLTQADADVYYCGPEPFMDALRTLLMTIGFEADQLHHEIFGPGHALVGHA